MPRVAHDRWVSGGEPCRTACLASSGRAREPAFEEPVSPGARWSDGNFGDGAPVRDKPARRRATRFVAGRFSRWPGER